MAPSVFEFELQEALFSFRKDTVQLIYKSLFTRDLLLGPLQKKEKFIYKILLADPADELLD